MRVPNHFSRGAMRSYGPVTINSRKMSPSARDYRVRVRSTARSSQLRPYTPPPRVMSQSIYTLQRLLGFSADFFETQIQY